ELPPTGLTSQEELSMRRTATALVWLLVIAVGTAGSEFYKKWVLKDRVPLSSRVEDYRAKWKEVLTNVKAAAPLDIEEAVASAALGQQAKLRQKLTKVDQEFLPKYHQTAAEMMDNLLIGFKEEWQDAFDTFADTPSVDEFLKSVHEYHQQRLKDRLTPVDKELKL